LIKKWNRKWELNAVSCVIHLFFPTINHAQILDKFPPTAAVTQALSGQSKLNKCLFSKKLSNSPLCAGGEEETLPHFLFFCPEFASLRTPFINSVTKEKLNWPPQLQEITNNKEIWLKFCQFIKTTKRLA
jgi:hypothetical protein